ncbi:uncharacterized protein MYCGRDRAFT_97639 [Zymoseptoria tritici IPO323]|uniref:Uncharacterized protein n=1 Tax=Zymoseptoria tritici (strain CBS 115943 / IPO323) TaxID=336722 RepID=F9XR32_ZYMTI|nr:uncharacterized protein MYCGRDRAFT_97639 [Zymoseptoria tritici IPO323]EGP82359.1 hypothetical protein MYCGRDRAFT_97639 [Zymoseptoria tritici IPO323]
MQRLQNDSASYHDLLCERDAAITKGCTTNSAACGCDMLSAENAKLAELQRKLVEFEKAMAKIRAEQESITAKRKEESKEAQSNISKLHNAKLAEMRQATARVRGDREEEAKQATSNVLKLRKT